MTKIIDFPSIMDSKAEHRSCQVTDDFCAYITDKIASKVVQKLNSCNMPSHEDEEIWKKKFLVLESQFRELMEHVKYLTNRLQEFEEGQTTTTVKVTKPIQEINNSSNGKVDEQKAEKWLRENTEKWLDEPCLFKRAGGRTWRQLAMNAGDKILINGKGQQSPRSYLHAVENWKQCKIWARMKAKVALETIKSSTSIDHYNWPEEIGG